MGVFSAFGADVLMAPDGPWSSFHVVASTSAPHSTSFWSSLATLVPADHFLPPRSRSASSSTIITGPTRNSHHTIFGEEKEAEGGGEEAAGGGEEASDAGGVRGGATEDEGKKAKKPGKAARAAGAVKSGLGKAGGAVKGLMGGKKEAGELEKGMGEYKAPTPKEEFGRAVGQDWRGDAEQVGQTGARMRNGQCKLPKEPIRSKSENSSYPPQKQQNDWCGSDIVRGCGRVVISSPHTVVRETPRMWEPEPLLLRTGCS